MKNKIEKGLDNITIAIFIVSLMFSGIYAHNYGHHIIETLCFISFVFMLFVFYYNNN